MLIGAGLTRLSIDNLVDKRGAIFAASPSMNKTVLIVEDDMSISNALASFLELAGYDPVQVTDVETLAAEGLDAPFMTLDVALRDCDAVDVIQQLCARRFKGAVQIISGNSLELLEDIRKLGEGRGLNMLPVIRKPVHPASLAVDSRSGAVFALCRGRDQRTASGRRALAGDRRSGPGAEGRLGRGLVSAEIRHRDDGNHWSRVPEPRPAPRAGHHPAGPFSDRRQQPRHRVAHARSAAASLHRLVRLRCGRSTATPCDQRSRTSDRRSATGQDNPGARPEKRSLARARPGDHRG